MAAELSCGGHVDEIDIDSWDTLPLLAAEPLGLDARDTRNGGAIEPAGEDSGASADGETAGLVQLRSAH